MSRAETFIGETDKPYVIINTEWGAFGDDGILDIFRTKQDFTVDKNSINPGKQVFEKMISGMYMGEMVRLLLMDLAESGLFLQKVITLASKKVIFLNYLLKISFSCQLNCNIKQRG